VITLPPRWFVLSLINANRNTTTKARRPPTAANALAVILSNPRALVVLSIPQSFPNTNATIGIRYAVVGRSVYV
jgi:hypothetical protein